MTGFDLGLFAPPDDEAANSSPVQLAIGRLGDVVAAAGGRVHRLPRPNEREGDGPALVIAGGGTRLASKLLEGTGIQVPASPESVAVVPAGSGAEPTLLVSGSDTRGLAYGVHELADRFEHSPAPRQAHRLSAPLLDVPKNKVRSVTRLFCSEVMDKLWFYDEAFWEAYLAMLVAQRFNRFSLTLGLGYNYPQGVTDAYFYFAYPFLVDVAGFPVRVPQLPDGERDRNLAALRRISERAHAHGLEFQLGLWTHAYRWFDSPQAHHTIEGLSAANHGSYCREAIRTLLEACPAIDGVTLRIHGESGVPERSWDFWRMVFDGICGCGRTVGIDLHAKGLDERILGDALGTGLPVTVSPKFWAEHMGLPYHQAAIRESERPPREDPSRLSVWHSHMSVSEGNRPYTRYGYGDFLREIRPYDLVHRIWAGTQRLLLWGDPVFAAAYGRAAGLAGGAGLELMEPLTFRGREGTGNQGPRTGYADAGLVPRYDWEKYQYTYRLFGRLSYEPDGPPDVWRRFLGARFGPAARPAEEALASASRILPLVTVAHHQSASNNYYWPEAYTNMPIVEALGASLDEFLIDTPEPKWFGTVVPLDPEVFMSIAEYVEEWRGGLSSGRIGPLRVAGWLDELAQSALQGLPAVTARTQEPEARRWAVDVAVQAHLGRFFAAKLRAATYYEVHLETAAMAPLRAALSEYEKARAAWADVSEITGDVYATDITFGPQPWLRGHWRDRGPGIDADIWAMGNRLETAGSAPVDGWSMAHPDPHRPAVQHVPPRFYRPGEDVTLRLDVDDPASIPEAEVRFRPMNQALRWTSRTMAGAGSRYSATVEAGEVDTSYPLAYAFVVRDAERRAWRVPDLGPDLAAQPYYVIRRADRV